METLIIGICDDEKIYRDEIGRFVEGYLQAANINGNVMCFADGTEVLEYDEDINILFLDEEMGNLRGLEVKDRLEKRKSNTAIIYITSHDEIMQEAFGKNVYGFLTKPISYKSFASTLEKVIEKIDDGSDIIYIGAESQYIRYHFHNGKTYLEKNSLSNFLEKEKHGGFVRCHRTWVVNLNYIARVDVTFNELVMEDGKVIPISRREKTNFKAKFMEHADKHMKMILGE